MLRKLGFTIAAITAIVVAGVPQALAQNPPHPSWQTNGTVRTVVFANGVVYLGGQFSSMRPAGTALGSPLAVTRHNAAAINATTGKLTAWNPNVAGRVDAIRVANRRAYLGGLFTAVGGKPRTNAAAVGLAAGKPSAWRVNTNGSVRALAIAPGGNVLMGGDFTRVAGAGRSHLAAVTPAGRLTGWAPKLGQITGFACPPRCHPVVFSIRTSPNGKNVYFGGHFGLVNGVARNEAAEVPLAGGKTTLAFNPNIYSAANCPTCTVAETSRVYTIIPTPTRVYTCGGYWKVNGALRSFNVSAFDPTTGELITGFRGQDDGDTPGCALHAGVLYIGGHFNLAGFGCQPDALQNCATRHHVAGLDASSGRVITGWNPGANSVHGLLSIASAAHAVAFGGYFTRMGGTNRQGLALYRSLPPSP
jgi:hypothetical protein